MDRQAQNPRMDRIDGTLLYTGRPSPAPNSRLNTLVRPDLPPVTQTITEEPAQERQQALEFLHKLVMGQ